MDKKIKLIQQEFSLDIEPWNNYLVIVEIVDNVPTASYTVKVPMPHVLTPNQLYLKN